MILGAYWSGRSEPEDAAASRVAQFLAAIARLDPQLSAWLPTGGGGTARERAIPSFDTAVIRRYFSRIRTDTDDRVIEDLGWHVSLWSGGDVSLRATIGLFAPNQSNSVVLTFGPRASRLGVETQTQILRVMIKTFEPDHAVATDNETLDAVAAELPWQAGWITYRRGGELRVTR